MKKRLSGAAFILFLASLAQAQTGRFVEVYGHAQKSVVPNEIFYAISIDTEKLYDDYEFNYDYDQFDPVKSREIQNKVELRVNSARQKLLELAEGMGLSEQLKPGNPYTLAGSDNYAAESYTIKLSDFSTLERLVAALKEFELFQGYVLGTTHADEAAIREELQLEALQQARLKAQKMAKVLDARLGPVMQIRENAPAPPDDIDQAYYNNVDYYGGGRQPVVPTQQTIELQVGLLVRFALE